MSIPSIDVECPNWEKKTKTVIYVVLIITLITVPLLGYFLYITIDTNVKITVDFSDMDLSLQDNQSILVFGDIGDPSPSFILYAGKENATVIPYSIGCYIFGETDIFMFETEALITQWETRKWLDANTLKDEVEDLGVISRSSITELITNKTGENTMDFHISSDYYVMFVLRVGIRFNEEDRPMGVPDLVFITDFIYIPQHLKTDLLTGEYTANPLIKLQKGNMMQFNITGTYIDTNILYDYFLYQSNYRWYNDITNMVCPYPYIINGSITQSIDIL